MDASTINIKLMADIADLQAKMAQAQSSVGGTMTSIENSTGLATSSLVGLAGGMAAMAVAAVAAMATVAKRTIDAADAMNDLSQRVGISVQDLAKYELASAQSGTTMEALAKGIKGLGANLVEHGDALKKAGITATDADGALRQVADVFAAMPPGIEKTNLAVKLFGKSGMDLIPMLNLGSQGLDEAAEKSAKYAAQMAAMAPIADAFNDNLAELSMHSKTGAMSLVNDLLPGLVVISKAMSDAAKEGGLLSAVWAGMQAMFHGDDLHKANMESAKGLDLLMSAEKALEKARASGDTERAARLENTVRLRKEEYDLHNNYRKMLQEERDGPAKPAAKPVADPMASYKAIMAALGGDGDAKKAAAAAAAELEKQAQLLAQLAGLTPSFAKEWDMLNAVYARGALTTDQLTEAQAALLAKQPAIKKEIDEAKKAIEAEEKATLAAADAHLKFVQTLEQGVEKMQADVTAQQEANDRMGLTKEAIAALDAAKLESQALALEGIAIKKLERDEDQYQYDLYIKQAKALRDLGAAKQAGAVKASDIESFNTLWQSVDKTAHDVFVNIFDGGQDAFTKLANVLKSTLLDLLYQMTLKKWIFDITASVSGGAGVSGAAIQAASGGSSLLSGAGSLFGGAGGYLSQFASGFSGSASAASAMMGGAQLTTAASMGAMAATVMPYVAAALVIKNLTGYNVTPTGNGLTATLGANGLPSGQVGTYAQFSQTSSGILSGGNTTNRDWGVADAETTRYISESAKAATASNRAYGDALGLSSAALDAFTASIEINTTGMDAAAAKAAIDAALTKFAADQAAAAYGDAIAAFAQEGETASQTLARLGTNLTAANQWAQFFGTTMFDVSVTGAAAASRLVTAFGNLEAMNAALSSYYQNYYTQAEQDANTYLQIQSSMAKAGIDISIDDLKAATKEGVRAYVESARLMMLAGQITEEQFALVLNNANRMAPIIGREPAGPTQEQQDAAYEQARRDWAITHPWEDAAGSYLNKDGSVTQGGLFVSGGGGGGGNGINAGGSAGSANTGWQDAIKNFINDLNTTAAGGLDIFTQRNNAWASYQTQLTLAVGGDQKALGNITGYAKTYLDAIKNTSRTSLEEAMAIAKIKQQLGGLLDQTPEQKIVDAITTVNDTLAAGFGRLTGEPVTTSGGGMAGGGALQQRLVSTQSGNNANNNSDVVAELREMRTQFADMQLHLADIKKTNAKLQKDMSRVTSDGEAIQTVAA